MKKFYLKKVNPTMVEQLVNYENYKIKALAQMTEFVLQMTEFVNISSISNKKEEAIEEYKQMLENDEEEPTIVLGGEFEQYVLTYDEFSNNIFVEDENDDTFSFGVEIQDLDLDDYYTYVDIADELNDQIEEYFEDEIIEDCGEYWKIKE
jgi:pyruvate/2-oxoacid:ferredoxin oxidoreductase alpha subunit